VKRTYALGLLAAATLGCFLTLQPISQVEVNNKLPQNAAVVVLFQDLTKAATRTNWITQVQVITKSIEHPKCILIKMPKWRSCYGNAVLQNQPKTFRSNSAFNYKGNKRFY